MSRYTGPVWRVSRRLSYSVLENGTELQRRNYIPGQHGSPKARPKKKTEYGAQMAEKQKLRFTYGVSEKQFRNLFVKAKSNKEQVTGVYFIQLLESRLDNLVFRMGFARTRRQARQLVNHGHVTVNGKKVDIPSYLCSINDVISFKESSKNLQIVKECIASKPNILGFVNVDTNKVEGTFVRLPERNEVVGEVNEAQITEYYNRKL